jgi:hypothetical protein
VALKLKVGSVQERLRLTMHWLGRHVQDCVQTHSEIRRQTDETLLHNCIRKGKWAKGTKYAEYAEYTEYTE